jgi:hypothetical protein
MLIFRKGKIRGVPMATYTSTPIGNIPLAECITDLESAIYDFKKTIEFCEAATNLSSKDNAIMLQALTVAAVIQYIKPFVSGVRGKYWVKLREQILKDDLTDIQKKTHDSYFELRHKHIAHSTDLYDRYSPTAQYCDLATL